MSRSNPFSIARNFFSSSARSRDKATRDGYEVLQVKDRGKEVFEDALHTHLDGMDPNSGAPPDRLNKIARIFSGQLKARGPVIHIATVQGIRTPVRATGFGQVFKNEAGANYHVEVSPAMRLMRTEAEVRTHVLLESHLRHVHGDASVPSTSVIDLEEARSAPRGFSLFSRLGKRARGKARTVAVPVTPPAAAPTARASGVASASASLTPSPSRLPSRPAVPNNPRQEAIVEMFNKYFSSNPLSFFEAAAKENPRAAAYLAFRRNQMRTPVGPELQDKRPFSRSACPGILVAGPGSTEMIEGPRIRFESDDRHAAFQKNDGGGNLEMHLLREDLRNTFAMQNEQAAAGTSLPAADADAVFPLGLAAAIDAGGLPNEFRFDHALDALSTMPDEPGPAADQWRKRLTADHPAAAAFLAFAEEGLLIQGLDPEQQCERFHYVDDFLPVQQKAMADLDENCQMWAPTFLAGVERNPQIPGDAPNSWRIRQGDTWIHGCTRQEVLRHVLFKTLEDLTDTDGANTTAQVFPLCAYALLAQAIGKPVPQHLQDHEKAIVSRIAENRDELAARRIGQAEASRQSAIATEQSKQFFQEEYRRNRVAGPIQLAFCSSGLDPQKITAGSIEANFAINSTDSSQLGTMRGIQSVVSETHVRQAISARDKNLAYTDNQCWLRSSWLSLLQSASPEVLAARLQEMGSDTFAMSPSISPKQLAHIASQFRANPTHFLHREGMPADLADAVDRPAQLGAAIALEQKAPRVSEYSQRQETVETVLAGIQRAVAAGFRYENDKIMNELEMSLQDAPLSSDMAMSLHRGFNVPALIIEVGEPRTDRNGNPELTGSQIRVAAPKGSPLEARVNALIQAGTDLATDKTALQALLQEFADCPVIWLERDHYDVYLPKNFLTSSAT